MKRSNLKYLLITALIICCLIATLWYLKNKQQPQPSADKVPETKAVALSDYLPSHQQSELVIHTNFTLVYSEKDEQARWVAYQLTRAEVEVNTQRSENFREDPLILTGSASLEDYRGSGYDRGHLAPAGDMGFTPKAMSESFYLSNISPQDPEFNRGIWRELEEKTRKWAVADGSLYIVTGPVLKDRRRKSIGANKVTVPARFYKVLLDYQPPKRIRAIAFLMSNKGSNKPLQTFAVSIDAVEEATGLDFFPALADDVETPLESAIRLQGWLN